MIFWQLINPSEELPCIINANGKKIGIISIYGPNNDDPKFYRETLNKVLTNLVLKTDELNIAGDFNISLSDSIGYMGKSSYKKEALAECVRIWNLKDVVEFKAKKCDIKPLTYIHTTKNESANKDTYPLKAARLDGIYTTIDPSGVDIMIGKFYPSDHASIRAVFPENKESGKKVWKLNIKQLHDEKLIEKWKKIAGNLTEANKSLREKLDSEKEISAYRYNEILGKDALRRWTSLISIIKANAIKDSKEKAEEENNVKNRILSRQEIKTLEKDELNDVLNELNAKESEKMKIKSELKNYELNATNKRLIKHKGKLEHQSRNISKIIIGDQTITNSRKIKEGIQRFYKFQFRCQCKNKKVPKPCAICKSNPVQYAKNAAKNFKKRTYRQKRITNKLNENLEQDITIQEIRT